MSSNVPTALPSRNAVMSRLSDVAGWLSQMKAALNQPYPRNVISGHVEIARQVERGIDRFRGWGIDPRL